MLILVRDTLGNVVPRLCRYAVPQVSWRLCEPAQAGPQAHKLAALTFDDGPTPKGTADLLSVLEKFDVSATHFFVGENAEKHPEIVRATRDAGHEIGNHSWSHRNGWRLRRDELIADYQAADEMLSELVSEPIRWVRPPYGKGRPLLIRWATSRKQRVAMWNMMPPDFSSRATVDRVSGAILKIRPRALICLHDNRTSHHITPQALRETLPRLIDNGWQFVTLSANFER